MKSEDLIDFQVWYKNKLLEDDSVTEEDLVDIFKSYLGGLDGFTLMVWRS